MKTLSTVTRWPRLIATTIFGALALSLGAVSTAADHSDAPHTAVVYLGDLNVSNPVDDATLYRRIETAASEVCESYATDDEEPDALSEAQLHACVHKAIENALNQVHLPQLFAMYKATSPALR